MNHLPFRFIVVLSLAIMCVLSTFVNVSFAEEPDFGGSGQSGSTSGSR